MGKKDNNSGAMEFQMGELSHLKLDHLLLASKGEIPPPITMELNLTDLCNLRCISCWQRGMDKISKDGELSDERLLFLIDEAANLGIKEVRIPGSGEPMVRRELMEKLSLKIKQYGLSGLLITNGTLLSGKFLAHLVDIGWDNLTISIDGASKKVNDYLRGKRGAFKKAMKAINHLAREKERKGKNLPYLRINTVISRVNLEEIPKIIELAYENNVQAVSFQAMTIFSPYGEAIKVRDEELGKLHANAIKAAHLAEKYKVFTNIFEFIDGYLVEKTNEMHQVIKSEVCEYRHPFLKVPCFEPWYNVIILPKGQVGPCSVFGGRDGDSLKDKTLGEVWNGEVFNHIRRKFLNGTMMNYCYQCCVPVFLETSNLRRRLASILGEIPIEDGYKFQ